MMAAALPTRVDIVVEARNWIGTPYRHQASLRGIGCDCLGLVRGVYRNLYDCDPEVIPAYGIDWAELSPSEILVQGLARHLIARPLDCAQAGDVLVFRLSDRRPAKHAAIATDTNNMVHAWERSALSEVHVSAPWRRRIAYVFSFPDVMD